MRKYLAAITVTAAIIGAVGFVVGLGAVGGHALVRDAQAITVPYAQQPRIGMYNEAGVGVAAGAVINSAVLNLERVSECTVIADNSGGGSARNLIANWLANDGTTIVYQFSTSVAIGTRGILTISPTAATASLPATVVAVPAQTGKKMSFTLSAAGAAAGSLVIICQ